MKVPSGCARKIQISPPRLHPYTLPLLKCSSGWESLQEVPSREQREDSLPCAWLPSQTSPALPLFPTVLTHPSVRGHHLPPAVSREVAVFCSTPRNARRFFPAAAAYDYSPWPPQGPRLTQAGVTDPRSHLDPHPRRLQLSQSRRCPEISPVDLHLPDTKWAAPARRQVSDLGGGGSRYPGGRVRRQQINNTVARWKDRCDFIY